MKSQQKKEEYGAICEDCLTIKDYGKVSNLSANWFEENSRTCIFCGKEAVDFLEEDCCT